MYAFTISAIALISILDDFSAFEQCQVYFVKTKNKTRDRGKTVKQTFSLFLAS